MQVHPQQISPSESYDVFYFIRNHTDAATYYVQAKIHDVRTGELLTTVKLDQSPTNARLFIKTLQAPPDPVGYGRNIVSIATVYEDAGFTIKSQNYEEQEQYYLVKAAPVQLGGGMIDYRAIADIIEEKISGIPKPEPAPKPQEVPFDALFGAIGALQREINRIPKEATDLSTVLQQLDTVAAMIANLPEPKEPDPAPLIEAADEIRLALQESSGEVTTAVNVMLSEHERMMQEQGDKMLPIIEKAAHDIMSRQELTIPLDRLVNTKQKQEQPFDITSLYAS